MPAQTRASRVEPLSADPLVSLQEMTGLLTQLAESARLVTERMDYMRRRQIEQARAEGASWEQIAETLDMTPQDAIDFYAEPTLTMLAENAAKSDLTEEEGMELAVAAVKEVRAERAQREASQVASARSG